MCINGCACKTMHNIIRINIHNYLNPYSTKYIKTNVPTQYWEEPMKANYVLLQTFIMVVWEKHHFFHLPCFCFGMCICA